MHLFLKYASYIPKQITAFKHSDSSVRIIQKLTPQYVSQILGKCPSSASSQLKRTICLTKMHICIPLDPKNVLSLTETIPESGILLEKAPTSSDF